MDKVRTLKLNKEFKRAYYAKTFRAHPLLVTYRVKSKSGKTRIGITSSKKIGCAVLRNRSRRVIRAAFYGLYKEIPELIEGYDYVFVARAATPQASSDEIKKVMQKHFSTLRGKK